VIAALAARVGREVVAIDTQRMPRAPREMVAMLRNALFRANVHGLIPMLSGLEAIEPTDADLREMVRQVLRTHPGPVIVRTSPESMLPMDAGFITVTLPPLLESQRADVWAGLCGELGISANFDHLASRYRIGPGVIQAVASHVASRRSAADETVDQTAALDEQVRQYVATRLDHVATRITRVASWEDVALPEEMLDSLREFIGRARHRRIVFENWGYEAKMSTARGLTALFYGPPGTGKTMVAGVIATELGLDLYRVDLARVVSKWLGETEKNLAEVFDAAEDGQVLILFDEADSLFAKRTDVKTSNDRYANLEVNYLLQRLDTFEGVAVLTSNLDGAIDPAFKRRLSLRLQFPFPDEDMRVRLWAAHVTPQTPTEGQFDFADLARRFPMSGGYIRNAAIRAAFLAAHEGRSLSQDYLMRAIQLEYREMGKLSTSTRIE
ncbi:MAG TPA: ATP-binding protein, partial [Kofleriaceae bacterium]|nr:ATP-binding protein [Kofleriaceae bacterium]